MNYRVKIKNPNKMFIVNNKSVRSPFECFVNINQLQLIKSRIKFYGLLEKEYEIEIIDLFTGQKEDYSVIQPQPKRELDKTIREKTIVTNQEQLHKDINKTQIIKPKQKVLVKEKKVVHQPQIILPRKEIIKECQLLEMCS